MIGLFLSLLLSRQIIGYLGLGQEVHLLQKGSNKSCVNNPLWYFLFLGNLQQCDLIEKMIKSFAASGRNLCSNGDSPSFSSLHEKAALHCWFSGYLRPLMDK